VSPASSVIIPAHNEGERIGSNLARLTRQLPDDFQVIVVANGCTDATAAVARSVLGVEVIELAEPGKAAALRAGDAAATRAARIYLDADIPLAARQVVALADAASQHGALAATGQRQVVTRGCALPVRAYYAVNRRLPVFGEGLFGRGVIAVSAAGRARFEEFPEQIADDLFLDSLFSAHEKRHLDQVVVDVAAPRRTAHLIRRLARVRSGNRTMRTIVPARPASHSSWLRVVLSRPWLWPAGICYAGITAAAELQSRRASLAWGHTSAAPPGRHYHSRTSG
jgi:glycosyltransferase involved in cell wall biosynthesis